MTDSFYTFDPCSLDGSDEPTLDNWTPTQKKTIIQSEWRKTQIGSNFNQQPSLDDLKKINMYLKKKTKDTEIMDVFGINCETLSAIKKNKYCPVEGIDLDNLSKIQKEFQRLNKNIMKIQHALKYIAHKIFISEDELKEYNNYCKEMTKASEAKIVAALETETDLEIGEDEFLD